MANRGLAVLVIAILALSMLPLVTALAPVDGTDGSAPADDPDRWWLTWPSDMDRDGIHDWLEDLARDALANDPDSRLDIVVDLERAPSSIDVARLEGLGMEVQHVSVYVDAVLGSVPVGNLDAVRALPGVVMLEAQGRGMPFLSSAVPAVGIDYVHEDLGFDGTGVTVAVLDTGINANHVALDDLDDSSLTDDPKLVAFFDAYANTTAVPYDSGEHGTWVAGIATGTSGGNSPHVGGAPGANLVGARIGSPGGFPEYTAMRGLEWAIANKETYNISVMVCSWGIVLGGPNDHNGNSAISRAADRAVEAGISVVVAAGNSALSATVTSPGDAHDVVTVGSVNDNGRISSFSSEGPTTDGRTKPDVCAPGEDITGAWSKSNTGYYEGDGTSAAAPLVGGLIALMLEANPDLTPAQVKQILHEASEHNTELNAKYFRTPNNGYGWGVVHAPGAVSRARDLRAPSIDIPVSIDSGEELDLTVEGSYVRTQHTDRGENGESRFGDDDVIIEITVPDEWDRPSRTTSTMEGDIIATGTPTVTSEDGHYLIRVTYRVIDNVDSITVGTPTITFTTVAPVTSSAETYTFTTRETLNNMAGPEGRTRVSVGGNVPPEIQLTNPDGGSDIADAFYVIRWTDDDPDDNARITLYNDPDTDPANGRVMIVSNLAEDSEGEGDAYVWDTSTLVEGRSFYIQAVIDDGANEPFSTYSASSVTIRHTGGNSPPSIEVLQPDGDADVADLTFTIEYLAYDPDDVASVSLYWDVNDFGYDGTTIVRDLDESNGLGTYSWDTSTMEEMESVYVYAVASDGQNPQARAYGSGPLTIRHDTGPRVEYWSPTDQDVPLDEPVVVTFDRDMDHEATEAATSIVPSVPGTFSWTAQTMFFTPGGGWTAETDHTVTVSTGARDAEGEALVEARQWSFRTTTSSTPTDPPTITITTPAQDATVSSFVMIEGTGRDIDDSGKVEVRIDGGDWMKATGTTNWYLTWDSELTTDGRHTISVRGTDGGDRTGPVVTVNVTVRNAPNNPPVVETVEDLRVNPGQLVKFLMVASDPDGDDLTFSDDALLFDIDPGTGAITFTPAEVDVGVWRITITVSDGTHQTKTTFIITVEPKEEDEAILGLPFTSTQLMAAIVLLLIVAVIIAMGLRSRRRSRAGKGTDITTSRSSRGDAA